MSIKNTFNCVGQFLHTKRLYCLGRIQNTESCLCFDKCFAESQQSLANIALAALSKLVWSRKSALLIALYLVNLLLT